MLNEYAGVFGIKISFENQIYLKKLDDVMLK